jgi:RING finger/CHY zinc finger protein 1
MSALTIKEIVFCSFDAGHVQAACCSIFYPCKICHDELYKGPKANWCHTERMEFEKVPQVKCLACQTIQVPAEKCANCGIQFGVYSCLKCRLYENKP